ncbi:hypothetical protein BpHYR1_048262 [Brachionus plicatilis]|uniref:Uncharacterized protein n=1 Tax=Brachionus plicatilis TaxID=10195 RepID=A0A3M7RT63_BRAPC|nr:hypothetical protein BpHYR1_048262 [Brachionus plicatilis]
MIKKLDEQTDEKNFFFFVRYQPADCVQFTENQRFNEKKPLLSGCTKKIIRINQKKLKPTWPLGVDHFGLYPGSLEWILVLPFSQIIKNIFLSTLALRLDRRYRLNLHRFVTLVNRTSDETSHL